MSKKKDDIKALLNEFKAEQKKFKEEQKIFNEKQNKFEDEQKKFNEKQVLINKRVDEQNKKNKRSILIILIVCLFISGISSALSYSIGASSVEYTAKDANWHVENTQQAIDDLYNSLGSSLVGSVYSYMGVSAPYGYLVCDGSTYNIEDYPRLANHINRSFGSYNYFGGNGSTTFAVPDLRGEFLRGSGTNSHSGQGSGAAVGKHQDGTEEAAIGLDTENGVKYLSFSTPSVTTYWNGYAKADAVIGTLKTGKYVNVNSYGNTQGTRYDAFIARPTNTSVLYIIKY